MITAAVTLVTVGLVTGLVYAQSASAAPVSIPSPVSGGWQLNGSAVLNTSASPPNLELTPATNWLVGSAFYPTAVPGVGISASFDIFIGSGNGADGMTFTLADASVTQPTALGNNGGGEGFSGITGIAVSFDTWQNTNDPSNNFVGIATTNSPQQQLNYVATNTTIPPLRNTVHHVVVTTNSTGITVTMDGTQVLNYATALPSNVLLGFTGATGGFADIHQVQNVNITVGPPPAAPAVTSLTPTSGPTAGGTSVTVAGTAFTGASSVMFGSTPATSYTVNSDTSITATAPAGNAGKVDVTVSTAGGTSAANSGDQYTYVAPPPTVTNVNPNSGPAGTLVTVTGTNFTGATEVDFGSGNKATFTVGSATTLTATVPAGTGTVDVTVITPSGTSATSAADQFTYQAALPPGTIPSPVQGGWQLNGNAVLNTSASPPNLQLTPATNWLVGSAFWPKPVTGVGITASFDIFIGSGSGADGMTFTLADASQTQPTALGNNGGGLGFSGIHGFAVAFDTWQSSVNPSNNFVGIGTYNTPQQQVNYVATNSTIPALRNTVHHITVTTNSTGITVIMDGTQVLNYATSLPSQVLVGFTGATGGFNDIHQVQNVNISTGPPPPAPTVTSVTPPSGPNTGGTQVTIGGTNLTGASAVAFGSTAATSFTVNSATSITATAPAGNAGAVDVTVTTAGGTSATSSADQFTYVVPPPPPPTVTVVSPATAPAGASITVSGSNFTGVTAVNFGSNSATFTVNNSTTLTATAPAGSGTVDVTVTNAGGTSKTGTADQFTYGAGPPPGTIPSPVAGGWTLNGNAVLNTSASPPNLQLTSATNWVVGSAFWPSPVASAGISASFDMFIGSGNGADGMTFTLADASQTQPTALGNNGGGLGFSGIHGVAVAFDTWKSNVNPSNNFVGIGIYNSPQQQVNYATTNASVPALRNTVHHIVVTTNTNGISVTMDGNLVLAYNVTLPSKVLIGFTGATGGFNDIHRVQNVSISVGALPPPPAVTGVSPTSGPTSGGSVVTITGTGFTGATSVKFGNTAAANYSINNDTNITATAPAGSAGAVDVTVVGPGGISATGSADQFTYTPPPVPTVTGVSPTSGPTTGGTPVTITGTGFTGATAVHFGSGNTATFTVTSDTTIAATAPPNATLGAVDITVTTPGGISATSSGDQFTFVTPPPPTVTAVTPNAGPGLTSVTIEGTNFSGATAVNFGANSSSFTVDSPTQITATAPSGPTSGAVDVTVTTPGGTSAKSSADQFTYQAGEPPVTMVATYRGDLGDSGNYPSQTGVTAANVATLNTKWTNGTGNAVGSYAQPIVANNLIYWGDWNGVEHATNFSGQDVWTVNTGQNVDNNCLPPVAGVSGTATLATIGGLKVDYFPGGDVNMYAVNALTGTILWKTKLGNGGAAGDYLWGSPVLFNGNLYQPVASFGDCPLVNGRLVEMNPYTGAIENTAYMENPGCTGGGIWSSPTVDASDGSIYVSTGTPTGCTKTNEMAPALVKLNATNLSVISSWTVPRSAQTTGDSDFGSTPVLFTSKVNGVTRNLIGCLNKNGIFYAWDRTNVAAGPVWQSTVAAPSGSPRSIASAAWDGKYIYVAAGGATLNGTSYYGNISALDPTTGAFIWRTGILGFMSAGITIVPGLLIEPYGAAGHILFLDPATGNTVRDYTTKQREDGEVQVFNGLIYASDDTGNLIAVGQ